MILNLEIYSLHKCVRVKSKTSMCPLFLKKIIKLSLLSRKSERKVWKLTQDFDKFPSGNSE